MLTMLIKIKRRRTNNYCYQRFPLFPFLLYKECKSFVRKYREDTRMQVIKIHKGGYKLTNKNLDGCKDQTDARVRVAAHF